MNRVVLCLSLLLLVLVPLQAQETKVLRAGMIGLDTSHVPAFTKLLNNPNNSGDLAGVRVVAGYPGSTDLPASRDRVAGFTKTLKEQYGVEIVASIDDLVKKVDVVLLECVDGRAHLSQAIPVIKAGKLMFIDKPMAGSLADVLLLFQLARQHKTPIFSSSSLRFSPGAQSARKNPKIGDIQGCLVHGSCSYDGAHPDLFWYGIHGIEMMFAVMGPGCKTVTCSHTKGTDLITGTWNDGRIATFRGIRNGKADYGGLVFGTKGIEPLGKSGGYEPLLAEICKFFKTGKAPVAEEETIDIFAFMEAAHESKALNGAPVSIDSVMQKARDINAKR